MFQNRTRINEEKYDLRKRRYADRKVIGRYIYINIYKTRGGMMHWPICFYKIAPELNAGSNDPWFVDRVFRARGA